MAYQDDYWWEPPFAGTEEEYVVNASRTRLAAVLADGGLDQLVHRTWLDGSRYNLRRLLGDLIEEYARHTGHADMVREAIDGRVGVYPRRLAAGSALDPPGDGRGHLVGSAAPSNSSRQRANR